MEVAQWLTHRLRRHRSPLRLAAVEQLIECWGQNTMFCNAWRRCTLISFVEIIN